MTTDMHKAPSVARNTGTSGDNATSVARYDLSTSEGGRSYISHFFATELRRHDFTDYIATHLAADFACALAQHLAATGKQQVGEVQGDARAQFEAWHCEKFKSRWQTGAPTRDMHNGVHAEKYGPAEQQVRWEAWQAAWQAALAARQPVCGTCAEVIEPDALTGTTCDCARQPGARVPVGYLFTDDPAVYAMPGSGFHSGKEPPADAINVVPVYAAPPAQGIDLAARPMDTAPRDGTLVRLLVDFDENAIEDSISATWTIGACNDDNVSEGARIGWQFAGWCWTHDHFTEGTGTPVGWLPLIDGQRVAAQGVSQ